MCGGDPATRSSRASRPSKLDATSCAQSGCCADTIVSSIRSMPPKRLPAVTWRTRSPPSVIYGTSEDALRNANRVIRLDEIVLLGLLCHDLAAALDADLPRRGPLCQAA